MSVNFVSHRYGRDSRTKKMSQLGPEVAHQCRDSVSSKISGTSSSSFVIAVAGGGVVLVVIRVEVDLGLNSISPPSPSTSSLERVYLGWSVEGRSACSCHSTGIL